LCLPGYTQVSITTQHNDLTRSGWNNKEQILTPANVNVRQFGKIFSVAVDDFVFAQPLILSNVTIGNSLHNIAVVCTSNSSVYVFDADNGKVFWSKNYTPPGLRVVHSSDFLGPCDGGENVDVGRDVGIIGTPVIDSTTATLYFVTRCTDAVKAGVGNFFTYLHAVDITTGNEKMNSPAAITGSVPGTSSDTVNGRVPFNAQHQNQRLALSLYNGIVFIGFSSQCDWIPYHGWIFAYDAASLQQKYIYNTTPRGMGGGLWESGGGAAIDKDGYMYVVSGNAEDSGIGTLGNPSNLINRAQSSIKLKITDTALVPVDFFTPSNFKLNDGFADLDYGSMASFLIPGTRLFFSGCKDGNLYILNADNLGGYNIAANQIVQTIGIGQEISLRCHPAYYESSEHAFAYLWSELSQLKAIPFSRGTQTFDVDKIQTSYVTLGFRGANMSTSSNASQDGTGILWISQPDTLPLPIAKVPQILSAVDANDVTHELWNSRQNIIRDSAGNFMKFAVPTVANGKVYLANSSGHINVYGIIDSVPKSPDCLGSIILSAKKNAFASSFSDANNSPSQAIDQDTVTQWSSSASGVQWIGVDLGGVDSICNISLQWNGNSSGKDFFLQVSGDSVNWISVDSVVGNIYNVNSINVKTSGRYVRIYCTAGNSSNNYALKELTVYGSIIYGCKTPSGINVAMIDTNSAIVRWKAEPGASAYSLNFKLQSSSLWQTYSTTNDSFFVDGLSCNTYYRYSVRSKCGIDSSLDSPPGDFNTSECDNCVLPTRTFQTDIGDIGIPGQACYYPPAIYYVNGSGADIGGNADAFRFVYKAFSGDGFIRANVATIDKIDPFNKAGVMIRENLSSNSRFVFLGLTSGYEILFLNRQESGDSSVKISLPGYTPPYFFKIVKSGNAYSGYISPDNTTWTLIGTMQNKMLPDALYAGMAVTSHDNLQLSHAKFKNFGISSTGVVCSKLPTGIKTRNIAPVKLNGDVCYYKYNRYVINGSGATVGNNADSLYYVYQQFEGNKTITVKVTEQDQTNALNKAGIMIRLGTKPNAPNVYIGLTSANGAFFQYRAVKNKSTTITYIPGYIAPSYLRLVRHQDTYTGYISSDGTSWEKIGETTIKSIATTSFFAGMGVTSNDTSLLSKCVFDGWTIEDSLGNSFNKSFSTETTDLQAGVIAGNSLKIYPNPAGKNFWIDFDISQKQNALLSIIGMGTGRIFFKENLINFSGHYYRQFTEALLPEGSYLVLLKCKEFKRVVTLVIQ
jgi:hypothetical protein